MKRALAALLGLGILATTLGGCVFDRFGTTSIATETVFDRQALIERVRARCRPIEGLLAETGDVLDYENLRFFTATNLNGADETVVSILLTPDSPSYQLCVLPEEEAPLEEIAPLPVAVLLPLDPCTSFHSLQNGVPYLYRVVSYEQAELVNANGEFVRYSTAFSWDRATSNPEPEWHKYVGNYVIHFLFCMSISTNQN